VFGGIIVVAVADGGHLLESVYVYRAKREQSQPVHE